MKITYHPNFPIELIDDNYEIYQDRLDYNLEEIKSLSENIEKNFLRNPIGITKQDDKYIIIYGFQRLKAIKLLGEETINVKIIEGTEKELEEQSIGDNEDSYNLSDVEKALRCKRLKSKGYSIEELCVLHHVKKSIIYNYLTISKLDKAILDLLHKGLISFNHGVELVRVEASKRLELANRIIASELSVRELKNIINSANKMISILEMLEATHPSLAEDLRKFWLPLKYKKGSLEDAVEEMNIRNANPPREVRYLPVEDYSEEEIKEYAKEKHGEVIEQAEYWRVYVIPRSLDDIRNKWKGKKNED